MSLVEFPNFSVEHRELFQEALIIWQQQSVEFNDAFNYVWARRQKVDAIYTYDKHFDRVAELKRLEP